MRAVAGVPAAAAADSGACRDSSYQFNTDRLYAVCMPSELAAAAWRLCVRRIVECMQHARQHATHGVPSEVASGRLGPTGYVRTAWQRVDVPLRASYHARTHATRMPMLGMGVHAWGLARQRVCVCSQTDAGSCAIETQTRTHACVSTHGVHGRPRTACIPTIHACPCSQPTLQLTEAAKRVPIHAHPRWA